jgi:hypothetical protein
MEIPAIILEEELKLLMPRPRMENKRDKIKVARLDTGIVKRRSELGEIIAREACSGKLLFGAGTRSQRCSLSKASDVT